jgi:serine/threonine protein kinase
VTTSGSVFGYTPNYAPLEQIQGTGTESRSDLYALAATLYHLVTNVAPPDVLIRLTATSDGQPDPLRPAHELNSEATAELSAMLNKAMAVGRNQRYSSAAEMRQALKEVQRSLAVKRGETKTEALPSTVAGLSETRLQPELISTELPPTVATSSAQNREELKATVPSHLRLVQNLLLKSRHHHYRYLHNPCQSQIYSSG